MGFSQKFPNFPELSCCEFWELSGERRQKMKLSMSSVDFRIVFVFGGEIFPVEARSSSLISRIFILFILEKSPNFGNFLFCQNIELNSNIFLLRKWKFPKSPTGPHFRARNFTSRHEKYAGIDRTHRELHFLPSLASQLAKLATGELG